MNRRGCVHRRTYTVAQWRAFVDGLTQRDSKRYEMVFQGATALTALLSFVETLAQIGACAAPPISFLEPGMVREHVQTLTRTLRVYSSLYCTYASAGYHVRRADGTYKYVTHS